MRKIIQIAGCSIVLIEEQNMFNIHLPIIKRAHVNESIPSCCGVIDVCQLS